MISIRGSNWLLRSVGTLRAIVSRSLSELERREGGRHVVREIEDLKVCPSYAFGVKQTDKIRTIVDERAKNAHSWLPEKLRLFGTVAVITKQEILLAIVGGIFVMEALSVILQVGFFKMTGGKRIFLMAPFHHHFEKKGWAESTIVIRFWIIALILALAGLSTLKLR